MVRMFLTALLVSVFLVVGLARAEDWPGWRGLDRTGVSAEKGLLKEWPKEGPPQLWKATGLGGGYSTPSVAAGKVYVIGSSSQDETAFCLDAKDGKVVWSTKFGKVGPNMGPQYPGSRSTPTVDGELVYCLASDGELACLDVAKGEVKWQKHLRTDFAGRTGNWAYAESPLIDGDVLVCSPGGSKATMVALNKKTGEVIWKAEVPGGDTAAYASPIVIETGNMKQYVTFLGSGVVGVDAKTGKFLWRYNKNAGRTNAATPIFHDGSVFSSASGGMAGGGGSALVKLTVDGDKVEAKEVYLSSALANHHGGVVRIGDYAFGTTNTELLCLDFKTGSKKWTDRSVGKGSVAAADGMLYVRSENGPVALVEATPDGYKEKGRFDQPERSRQKAWPHPIIADGKLYLRDGDILLCYDIKAK